MIAGVISRGVRGSLGRDCSGSFLSTRLTRIKFRVRIGISCGSSKTRHDTRIRTIHPAEMPTLLLASAQLRSQTEQNTPIKKTQSKNIRSIPIQLSNTIHAHQTPNCSTFLRRRPSLCLCAASSGCHKGEDGSFVTSGIQDLTFREEFAGKNH